MANAEKAKFIFNVNPCDEKKYVRQVSAALEKRTELVSRAQHPKMWARKDAKEARKKNKKKHWYEGRVWAICCIVLGTVLFIPGVFHPKELIFPLLAGALGIFIGGWDIHRGGRLAARRFDSAAETLLRGKGSMMPGMLRAEFTSSGLRFAGPGKKNNQDASYKEFECMVETEDTLMMIYNGSVLLLLKEEIVQGSFSNFRKFVSKKVNYSRIAQQ